MPGSIRTDSKPVVQVAAFVAEKAMEKAPQVAKKGVEMAKSTFEAARSAPLNLSGLASASPLQQPSGTGGTSGAAGSNPADDVAQGWNNTCGANALMAMEAAVSPERAAQFAAMTPEQRKAYEGAVLRSDPQNATFPLGQRPGGTTNGWGSYMMARQVSERFGGEAQVVSPADRGQAVDALTAMLSEGKPVAIGLSTHWMSATDIRDGAEGREILIHDSWTGTSVWVPEADLRQPGSGWVQTHFPGAAFFGGSIRSLVAPGEPVLDPNSTYRAAEATVLPGVQSEMNR